MPGAFPWVQCSSLLLVCAASAPRGLLPTLQAAGGDAEVARVAAQEALRNIRMRTVVDEVDAQSRKRQRQDQRSSTGMGEEDAGKEEDGGEEDGGDGASDDDVEESGDEEYDGEEDEEDGEEEDGGEEEGSSEAEECSDENGSVSDGCANEGV